MSHFYTFRINLDDLIFGVKLITYGADIKVD